MILNFVKLILTFFFYILCLHALNSQKIDNYTFHVQLTASFGTPVSSIGARAVVVADTDFSTEMVVGYGIDYNFKNYGPQVGHLEHNLIASAHYIWGNKLDRDNDYNSYVKYTDSRHKEFAIGYTWERFFNGIGTAQNVGTVAGRFNELVVNVSNDVLANTNGKDRYRTGAFAIGFLDGVNMYSVNMLIWTGDTHCKESKKYIDTDYPARWGYKDISNCQFGDLVHGILSVRYSRDIGYGQRVGAGLGVDSERLRNFIQNKIFHDMYFIPRFMNKTKNIHLPMKTDDGKNYLYKENQMVKPASLVWQLLVNGSLMY
ncbi:MAG: polymorphic toxin type 23 domain-containing protein [Saprospiraceae bacterium]